DAATTVTLTSLLVDRQAPAAPSETAGAKAFDPRKGEDMSGALQPRSHGSSGPHGERVHLTFATRNSALAVAVMAEHRLHATAMATPRTTTSPTRTETTYRFTVLRGESVTLEKLVAYHDGPADEIAGLLAACTATLDAADASRAFSDQRRWLDEFWADADVRVPGQAATQQALRWNLFQLVQASARADGRGIAAKGVTGSGYSGHYFWDTEIYVLPYLIHSRPA